MKTIQRRFLTKEIYCLESKVWYENEQTLITMPSVRRVTLTTYT